MPEFNFCPQCGHPLAAGSRPRQPQACLVCGHVYYRNSKPCVAAIITAGGKVLLVKRSAAPYKGWWDVPGGFLELGEHPRAGVIREAREETGLEVEPLEILDILVDTYGPKGDYTLNICYLTRVVGGSLRAGDDAASLEWFAPDGLPKRIAFANGRAFLAAWRSRPSASA